MDAQVILPSGHVKPFQRLEPPTNSKLKRTGHYPKVTMLQDDHRAMVYINTDCPEPPERTESSATYTNVNAVNPGRGEDVCPGSYVNVPTRNLSRPTGPPVPERRPMNVRHSAPQLPPKPVQDVNIHIHVHNQWVQPHPIESLHRPNPERSSQYMVNTIRQPNHADEIAILNSNRRKLLMCGWYHEKLTFDEANEKLKNTAKGTFLLRNSSDPRYLYALSVQQGPISKDNLLCGVNEGPTAIRVMFSNGKFHLDVQNEFIRRSIATFASVIELVEYYMKASIQVESGSGPAYSISLTKPLYKDIRGQNSPPSLEHLSRLSFHKSLESWPTWNTKSSHHSQPTFQRLSNIEFISELNLPKRVDLYVREYPHTI